jgi:hypothetical protein
MISLILIMCLATGASRGVCLAEMGFDTDFRVPAWATLEWQDYAAHIVASEARGVPQADIVVACTLIRDVKKGYSLSRWFGYGPPDAADRKAIDDALFTVACESVPHYRYVGNFRDAQLWRSMGMIESGKVDLYLGTEGQAVVGVP